MSDPPPTHPMQPLVTDEKGVIRFKRNAIVRYLLDNGTFSLNDIHDHDFSQEDQEQFLQLIGYSVDGFAELDDIVSKKAVRTADAAAEKMKSH